MRKIVKFQIILFSLIISLAWTPLVKAETEAYVTASALKIRSEASTSSTDLIHIYNGESVIILDLTKVSGSGCSSGWYKIKYANIQGFVCSEYITIGSINSGYNTSNFTARIYATTVTVRSSASTSSSSQATLITGTNVTVLETRASGSGCSDPWYKIRYHDNKTGYVCSTYVVKKENITAADADYEEILKTAGFPSSYWPYLVHLKNKYPNWEFKAIKTNLEWKNVVSGESGKNYIQNTIYDSYRTSSRPREGSSWFEATDGVNAFFLDPRNFLTEKFIFMFENLEFDEATQSPGVLKSIFGSSYLSSDEYVGYFIAAGRRHNVSPVHLASRVVQEGGSNSAYKAISGTSTSTYRGYSLTGYYNYYNIGAYADSYTSDPIVRGLAYARGLVGGDGTSYGRPWDSREKAIYGGAEFLSDGYISEGQYTLYFQKFNTSPTSSYSKYTHQYMTNVQAPTSEASNIYSSYKSNGIIGNSYVFAIPVYNNMPETVSLPTIGDVVNTLSSIKIDGINIPQFDPDILSYEYYIPKTANSLTLGATATSSLSTLNGLGTFEIDSENTILTIRVTSQTGEIKIYTIQIIKVSDTQTISEIFSNLDVKINDLNLTVNLGTTKNDLSAIIKKYSPSTTLTFKNASGVELGTTNILSTGHTLMLKTTANEIKTFTIIIKGDCSGDGKITILDLLQVQKHILNSKKLTNAYLNAADTSGDGKITILDLLQIQKHIVGDKKL